MAETNLRDKLVNNKNIEITVVLSSGHQYRGSIKDIHRDCFDFTTIPSNSKNLGLDLLIPFCGVAFITKNILKPHATKKKKK